MSDARIRSKIALLAARLMYSREESEYFTAKRKAARQLGVEYRYHPGDYESGNMLRLFRRLLGLIKYSKTERGEARSVPEFRPRSGDIVALGHWCSSGFASTDLDVLLKKDDIHQLIVIGL